ncbi:MAG: UDP-glucose/GDP-mannose dehydrogenase family protein [Candidatus Eisenbacteria bacterium]
MTRIAVVGTGYVGLVTGACLSDFGNTVRCVDVDAEKIARLSRGTIPFFEPGLEELVVRSTQNGRLTFVTDLAEAARWAEAIFITVGTPPKKDGSADLSAVFGVGDAIARAVTGAKVVVQKSTAPVGTARRLQEAMRKRAGRRATIDVASNPEFLREGSAIETYMRPDRVVVGAETPRSERLMRDLHEPLYLLETPITVTNLETAELIKYASNAFLAVKISFINEVANLCEEVGADVQTVARAMGQDRRIGNKFLHAGPGYGGSCFPKDTMALAAFARERGAPFRLVEAVVEVNERQKARMVDKIKGAMGTLRGRRVALLGLTFKPNTDDIREAPALDIARGLLRGGASIAAYDPAGMEHVKRLPIGKRIDFAASAYDAVEGADCAVLITEWNELRTLDLKQVRRRMRRPVLCDLRNVYDADEAAAAGLAYVGVGQGTAPRVRVPKPRKKPAPRTRKASR